MYQNIMLAGVAVMIGLVALRVYRSWEAEKARKPAPRSRPEASKSSNTRDEVSAQPFHCVTLVGNCGALRAYRGKRFLARTAPPLPVPGCTAQRCSCHYVHHADRRKPNEDRRALGRMAEEQHILVGNSERRKSRGRRKSDGGWATIDGWSKGA